MWNKIKAGGGWLVALVALVVIAWRGWPDPQPKPGPVELSKSYDVMPGSAQLIEAKTKADKVEWFLGDRPDGTPTPQLLPSPNPRAVYWLAQAKGRYVLTAAVSVGGEIKRAETVVVVGDAPPPGPDPGPGPSPGPLDEFQKGLRAAYAEEKDEAALKHLIDLFDAGAVQVRDAPSKTVYEFYRAFVDAGQKLVGAKLPKTRQTVFVLLGQRLPGDTTTPLDGPMRTKVAELFSYVAESLRKVR